VKVVWPRRVHEYRCGEPVIFRRAKFSTRPGPRAELVEPAPRGETYSYIVEKFWVVREVRHDGKLVLATRSGKLHVVDADAPQLRRPSLWERWRHRARFPSMAAAGSN